MYAFIDPFVLFRDITLQYSPTATIATLDHCKQYQQNSSGTKLSDLTKRINC